MRILVPLAAGEKAEATIDAAIRMAEREHAELVFCSAIDAPEIMVDPTASYIDAHPALRAQQTAAEKTVAAAESQAFSAGIAANHRIVLGPTAPSICRLADAIAADAIIMSTHARHPLAVAVLGSVTETVIRSTTVPVLVVPPHYHAVVA